MVTAFLLSACQPANDNIETPVIKGSATINASQADSPVMDPHAGHDMRTDRTPITPMLKEMMVGINYKDPDVAFAQGMLSHHIGAVDMAEIELKYSIDEVIRKLA